MSDTLYDVDVLAWSEQQAELLRRASTGERVNGLDWPNLIEEIDGVGKSQLHACESLLGETLRHLLKTAVWPEGFSVPHWLSEVVSFAAQARRAFAPSMRQHINIQELYEDSLQSIRLDEIDGRPAGPIAELCPFALEDLLAKPLGIRELASRLNEQLGMAPRKP